MANQTGMEVKEIRLVISELTHIMQETEGMIGYGRSNVAEAARILKSCIKSLKILKDLEIKIERNYKLEKAAESSLEHAEGAAKKLVTILRQREAELHRRSPSEEMEFSQLEKDIGIAIRELETI